MGIAVGFATAKAIAGWKDTPGKVVLSWVVNAEDAADILAAVMAAFEFMTNTTVVTVTPAASIRSPVMIISSDNEAIVLIISTGIDINTWCQQ